MKSLEVPIFAVALEQACSGNYNTNKKGEADDL